MSLRLRAVAEVPDVKDPLAEAGAAEVMARMLGR